MDTQKMQELKQLVKGKVAVAGDTVYEKARKMMVRTISPGVVVRPESNEDVAAIIRFITKNGLPFAIRSGGHSSIASRLADDLLLIDLSGLADIEVLDKEKYLVRVGGGALWYDVASELEKHGLGISSGDTRSVGVGGLSTGGGLGWMIRKYGPIVDNIVALEVVTADGRILRVSEDENSDLFWAVRGGGSNFGVVTHFTFRAHPVAGIFIGVVSYPVKTAEKVIKGWRDAMRQAPPELTTMLNIFPSFGDAPPAIMIRGCFEGTDKKAAEKAYAPFLKLGEVTHQEITAHPYKDVLEEVHPPEHVRVVVHNGFLKELSDAAIEAIAKLCQGTPPILQLRHVGGVMNSRPADATSFSHRDSEVLIVNPTFFAPDALDKDIEAGLTPWRAIEPFSQGCYLNLISEDTGEEVAQAYPPDTLKRLREIKSKYDPGNIFTANYNIK